MTIVVNTVSDSRDAQKDLAKLKDSILNIETSVNNVTSAFAKFGAAISASLAIAGTIRGLSAMSDSFTNLENKIKSVTETHNQFKMALQGVKDVAMATRSDLNATASLYQKIALNQKEIGINTKDTLRVVEIVGKALKISGANGQEAAAAMLQFGQALGSGKLQGDELRSLAENAPYLIKSIADGLGIAVGKLKEAAADGDVTIQKLLPALLKAGDDIDKKFSKLGITYGDAFDNLGRGVTLLLDSAKRYLFGTGSMLTEWINNVALGAAKIAKYFGTYMASARASVAMFVIKAIMLFEDLWPAVKEVVSNIANSIVDLYNRWAPELSKLTSLIYDWLDITGTALVEFYNKAVAYLSSNKLLKGFIDTLVTIKDTVINFFKDIFKSFNLDAYSIDAAKFFKNFEPVMEYIHKFVNFIERAFFWLYDKVIGHSWIPDLVEGVKEWLGKLNKEPLDAVKKFADNSNILFAGIGISLFFAGAAKMAGSFKLAILGVVSALGLMVALLVKQKDITDKVAPVYTKVADTVNSLKGSKAVEKVSGSAATISETSNKTAVKVSSNFKSASEKIVEFTKKFANSNAVTRTFKQIFGIQDTEAGSLFGDKINTSGYVGRGPKSNQQDRPFLHDTVNALPSSWQVPIFAGITGLFSLALAASFSNPAVKMGAVALFTTLATIQATKIIDKKVISEAAYGLVNGFLGLLGTGLEKLLGGNAIKDPLGLLAILAKFALLFKAGREAIGGAAKNIITSPTAAGRTVGMSLDQKFAAFRAKMYERQIANLPNVRQNNFQNDKQVYQSRISDLMAGANRLGQTISMKDAVNIAKTGTTAISGLDGLAKAAYNARDSFIASKNDLANVGKETQNLAKKQANFAAVADTLATKLREQRLAAIENVRNFASGAGGIVGGVAGLQLGNTIAEGMGSAPAWQKTAVIMATAFAGQFLASSVMSVLTSVLIGAFRAGAFLIGAAFTAAPFITGAVVISAAIIGGYLLFEKLPEKWKEALWKWDFGGARSSAETFGVVPDENRKKEIEKQRALGNVYEISGNDIYGGLEKARAESLSKLKTNTIKFIDDLFGIDIKEIYNRTIAAFDKFITAIFNFDINKFIGNLSNSVSKFIAKLFNLNFQEIYKNLTNTTTKFVSSIFNINWSSLYTSVIDSATNFITSLFSFLGDLLKKDIIPKAFAGEAPTDAKIPKPEVYAETSATKTAGEIKRASLAARKQGESSSIFADIKAAAKDNKDVSFLVDKLEAMYTNVKKAFTTNKTPDIPGATGGNGSKTIDENTFKKSLENLKPEQYSAAVSNVLKDSGFQGVQVEDIQRMQETDPAALDMLSNLTSKLYQLNDIAKRREGLTSGRLAKEEASVLKTAIDEVIVNAAFGNEPPSRYKKPDDATDDKTKKQAFKLRDQFRIISEIFPEMGMSLEEFYTVSDEFREKVFNSAKKLYSEKLGITDQKLGEINIEKGTSRKDTGRRIPDKLRAGVSQEDYLAFEADRKAATAKYEEEMKAYRNAYTNMRKAFADAGITDVSENVLSFITEDEFRNIFPDLEKLKSAFKTKTDPKATQQQIEDAQKVINDLQRRVKEITYDIDLQALRPYERVATQGQSVGVNFDKATYNRLGGDQGKFNQAIKQLYEKQRKLDKAEDLAPEAIKSIQEDIIDGTAELVRALNKLKAPTFKEKAIQAGEAFISSIADGFNSAFSGLLKSEQDKDMSVLQTFVKRIADSFSNTIIDTFSKGVTEKLFGSDFAKTMLEKLGTSLFSMFAPSKDQGTGVLSSLLSGKSSESNVANVAQSVVPVDSGDGTEGLFQKLISVVSGGFGGITGFFVSMVTSLASMLGFEIMTTAKQTVFEGTLIAFLTSINAGIWAIFTRVSLDNPAFATGGLISGPGSGKSDSILARVSNGEFVVNAQATKKALPLLQAINENKIPAFAEGGLIPNTVASIPSISTIQPANGQQSSSQVINISVTGDISRQTKSEIYKMLPNIAEGVRSHNKERGYR